MNLLPCAITLKPSKIAIDRFPRRKVARQLPPRTTGAHDIHYGVDHLAHVVSARATAPFGFRNQRTDQSPLTVRQIGGVWLPFHTTSSALRPLLKQVLRHYRRGRDSNPRYSLTRTLVFETSSFSRSDTSPIGALPHREGIIGARSAIRNRTNGGIRVDPGALCLASGRFRRAAPAGKSPRTSRKRLAAAT